MKSLIPIRTGSSTGRPSQTSRGEGLMTQLLPRSRSVQKQIIEPLPEHLSAREFVTRGQRRVLYGALVVAAVLVALRAALGFGPSPLWWAQALVATVVVGYLIVIAFKLALVAAAAGAPVLRFTDEEVATLRDEDLPVYSVLVPIYKEGKVLPTLVAKLSALDYPSGRLQILLLIEEDDDDTRLALAGLTLPPGFEEVII